MTRVPPPLTIAELAASPLNALEVPEPKAHFKLEHPDMADIWGVVSRVSERIDPKIFPDDLRENPQYLELLKPISLPAEATELLSIEARLHFKNTIRFIPRFPNFEGVYNNLSRIAENIANTILGESRETVEENDFKKAQRTIRNSLIMILRKWIEFFDNSPSIRVDLGKDRREREADASAEKHAVSTRRVREIVRKIRAQIDEKKVSYEEADLELMIQLGALPYGSIEEIPGPQGKEIKKKLRRNLEAAWKHYKQISEKLAQAQVKYGLQVSGKGHEGEQIFIDTNIELKGRSLFGLLDFVINADNPNHSYLNHIDPNEENLNEAQIIAGLTHFYYMIEEHPQSEKAAELVNPLSITFTRLFDEESKEVKAYKTDEGDFTDEEKPHWSPVKLRRLNIPGVSNMLVYIEYFEEKSAPSRVDKLVISPDKDIEDIFDSLRGRLVLWEFSSEDFKKPETRDQIILILEIILKFMNFRQRRVPKEQLKQGEACIADKTTENEENENSRDFCAIKIYGLAKANENDLNGVPFEIQVIPRDRYYGTRSPNSLIHNDRYALFKTAKVGNTILSTSIHPVAHIVMEMIRYRFREKML